MNPQWGEFRLLPNEMVIVPPSVLLQKCYSRNQKAKSSDTPMVARAIQCDDGMFRLLRQGEQTTRKKTKVIFVPSDAAGKQLIFKWIDPNCACAVAHNA